MKLALWCIVIGGIAFVPVFIPESTYFRIFGMGTFYEVISAVQCLVSYFGMLALILGICLLIGSIFGKEDKTSPEESTKQKSDQHGRSFFY